MVRAARPRVIVELGTHAGVSCAAFCEAVLQEGLDARCYAIDTWQGDEHAGFYDEAVFEELREFHDARYAGFSRLICCAFDAALPQIGTTRRSAAYRWPPPLRRRRPRFQKLGAKAPSRAVVLLHDTNVRERDFGVWRRWEELRAEFPGFEFLHAHGLGVLAVGGEVPLAVAALCAIHDPRAVSAVRERFALLGERWVLMQDLADARRARTSSDAARQRAEARAAELAASRPAGRSLALSLAEARNRVAVLEQGLATAQGQLAAQRAALTEMRQVELSGWRARAVAAEEQRDTLPAILGAADDRARISGERLRIAEAELAALSLSHDRMSHSISWRLTRPLRWARVLVHRPPAAAPIAPAMGAHDGGGEKMSLPRCRNRCRRRIAWSRKLRLSGRPADLPPASSLSPVSRRRPGTITGCCARCGSPRRSAGGPIGQRSRRSGRTRWPTPAWSSCGVSHGARMCRASSRPAPRSARAWCSMWTI